MAKRRRRNKPGGASSRLLTTPNREEDAVALEPVLPPLPDDLAEDIFLQLPVRSLAACRCVSPSWNSFLSSPTFRGRHHATAAARAGAVPRFVSVPVDTRCPRCYCKHIHPVICGAGGACRGAVLVGRLCEGQLFVCNPSTGGVMRLPQRRPTWCFHSAGLGYDAASGRHKAVLLEQHYWGHPPDRWPVPRLQCVVTTVGAGQWRWRAPRGRSTPIICEGSFVSTKLNPVFADGRLHWMLLSRAADGTRGGPDGVLAFTLDSESFSRLPLPPFADLSTMPVHATLAELDGHLSLVRDLRDPTKSVALFEVWMLRDHDRSPSSASWSLDRRIDLSPHVGKELARPWDGVFFAVCYVDSDESSGKSSRKILLATTTERAYMFEPGTGELRTVARMSESDRVEQRLRAVLYQESLMHVDGMEYDNKDIKFIFE